MEFILSNSKMHDYERLCPIEFKAKHIDKNYPGFEPTKAMDMGNIFETLVIGGTINGAVTFETSKYGKTLQNGEYGDRIVAQAESAKSYLKSLDGKFTRQEYIKVKLWSNDGTRWIWIEGTLDILFTFSDGRYSVIDLKFTGDTENDFGKFSWGSPEKMDLSQIKHYKLLVDIKYSVNSEGRYWVFDSGKAMKKKLIKCNISEDAIWNHKERLFEVADQINNSIALDLWEPKNTFDNCSNCKAKCKWERVIPEEIIIDL